MDRYSERDDLRWRVVETTGGPAWFAVSDKGLWCCELPRSGIAATRKAIAKRLPNAREDRALWPLFAKALVRFFAGRPTEFRVAIDETDIVGFRREVYRVLSQQVWGTTTTYGALAAAAGSPGAARSVGSAMSRNPFPPVVPCHRVLGSSGGMVGFTAEGGIDLKAKLIAAERPVAAGPVATPRSERRQPPRRPARQAAPR